MTPFIVVLGVIGAILILVGLVGGGFTLSTTEMPKVNNWVRLPCFGVGVVMVLLAVGLGLQQQPTPSGPPTSTPTSPSATSPSATDQVIATGTIEVPQGDTSVDVYSQPSGGSSVVARVANGVTVGILCTAQGDVVTRQDTGQSSSLWDGTSDGYIPDIYVDTGTNQATMTNC